MQYRMALEVSAIIKGCARTAALAVLAISIGVLGNAQTVTPPNDQQEHSRHIHEILQEAKSYEEADARTRAALEEILSRMPRTFAEFDKQCADLQAILSESDAMEARKRKMLAELKFEFRGDAKVQTILDLLHQMEVASDKVEPVWRGMIACSGILASTTPSTQGTFQTTCIDPAHQQLGLLAPEIAKLGHQLQAELQKYGESLPPDFLQAIAQ